VVLYGTTQWADQVPVADIHAAVVARLGAEAAARMQTPPVHTLEDLRAVLAQVDWVVASRYHGVATALLMRRPTIGIAYERKTADLMRAHGLASYAMDIEAIAGPAIAGMLEQLQVDGDAIRASLDAHARSGRAAVHSQFEAVVRRYALGRRET
jgi:polysaccharide pyruvyl transferase WcaK-like protein